MTLEATIICLDNSNYSRNGDYGSSRMLQQQDATNFISGVKTQQNPENLVGILSMAGERIELRVTPTSDLSKAMHAMDGIRLYGRIDLLRGIQVAQLALKHRLNKNLRQRIVCFVGSPLRDELTEKHLEKLGKILKKNNVSIDIISFGEISVNRERLQALVNAANNDNTSNFLEISPPTNLTDALMSSPIVLGEGMSSRMDVDGLGGSPGEAFEFGIDPSADPELYMALRMSMEEERIRQMRLEGNSPLAAAAAAASASSSSNPNSNSANAAPEAAGVANSSHAQEQPLANGFDMIPTISEINAMEVDDELRQALLLSIQDFSGSSSSNTNNNSTGRDDTALSQDATSASATAEAEAAADTDVDDGGGNARVSATASATTRADITGGVASSSDRVDTAGIVAAAAADAVEAAAAAAAAAASGNANIADDAMEAVVAAEAEAKAKAAKEADLNASQTHRNPNNANQQPLNPNSIEAIIQAIPGVDINDPRIQEALRDLNIGKEKEDNKQ